MSQRAQVRIHATSSLLELDRWDRVVGGSDQPMAWTQDLVAERGQEAARWLLSELGEMTISGPAEGPAGPGIKANDPTDLEKKERESIEHAAAYVASGLNFMSLRYRL